MSFYFGLRRVSLAEYLLVLRALFPLLLQMVKCTTAIALTACIRRWVTTRTKGKWSLRISHLMLLLEMTTYWHCIWIKSVCVALKLFASAISVRTWYVITLCSKLWCINCRCELYVTCDGTCQTCTILVCMSIGLKSFLVSRTTGLYGLKFAKLSASAKDFLT